MIFKEVVLAKIEENVEAIVKDKIESLGYELYDVLFFKGKSVE